MNNDIIEEFLKYFSRALMLLLIMPVTNSVRGLVAKRMGDDTSDRQGRITLNPFVHLDLLGSLCIMLVGFGWSKPMPIDPAKMKNRKTGIVAVSAAGPLSHFISAILCYHVAAFLNYAPALATLRSGGNLIFCLYVIFNLLAQINVCIGTINLLPLPPMDGFQIINQFMGNRFHRWYFRNFIMIQRVSLVILLVLFYLPDQYSPLMYLISFVQGLLQMTASWVPAVFG